MQEIPGADPRALDIPDPMGQGVSAYQQSYGIISEAVDRLVARLIAASSD
jgi:protein-tyrosine-phosphatase